MSTTSPSVRAAAAAYRALGWAIVPLLPGEKGTDAPGWLTIDFTEADVADGDNLGLKTGPPSLGLVDVDLDAKEAVAVAPAFLPATGRIHGRPGKRASHWWYACPGQARTLKWKDVDDASLVELRAGGAQTVVPPSIHPSGERLAWERTDDAAPVEPAEAVAACTAVATAAILARHWPGGGSRHEAALAAGGTLARFGIASDKVGALVGAAAKAAKDPEAADRERAARDSARKIEEEGPTGDGTPVSGAARLEALLTGDGPAVVARLRQWYGAEGGARAEQAIAELNAKHAIVFMQSGEVVVVTEDYDEGLGRGFLRYSSFADIHRKYPEPIVVGTSPTTGKPIVKKLGAWWSEHPKRRKYEGLEFRPDGPSRPGYLNLWRGFSVAPAPGDWSAFRDHIRTVICAGDARTFDYVLAWMAAAVQRPGDPAEVAIAIRGGQGAGKGVFVREFGRVFGQHFVHLDSSRHLTGQFNAHLHDAVLVFADEAAWPGDRAGASVLKRLVTEPTLAIERKGMDIVQVRNVIHLMLASNERWIVPAGLDDRRFCVLDASNGRAGDHAYFAGLVRSMREGGAAAMLHDLLALDAPVGVVRRPPKTKALLEQKILSMEPHARWWYGKLVDGRLLPTDEAWKGEINSDALHADYIVTLQAYGVHYRASKQELSRILGGLLPPGFPGKHRRMFDGDDTPRRTWTFPPLADARREFETVVGVTGDGLWT